MVMVVMMLSEILNSVKDSVECEHLHLDIEPFVVLKNSRSY